MYIGDIVECLENYDGASIRGKKGVIIQIRHEKMAAVEFYEPFAGGHTCDDYAKDGYGWWVPMKYLTVCEGTNEFLTKYEERA